MSQTSLWFLPPPTQRHIGFPDFCNDCDIIVEFSMYHRSTFIFLLPSLFTPKKHSLKVIKEIYIYHSFVDNSYYLLGSNKIFPRPWGFNADPRVSWLHQSWHCSWAWKLERSTFVKWSNYDVKVYGQDANNCWQAWKLKVVLRWIAASNYSQDCFAKNFKKYIYVMSSIGRKKDVGFLKFLRLRHRL